MQNQNVPALDLKRFGISAKRGFLPAKDPVRWWVNPQFSWGYYWEQLAEKMPKLLAAKKLRMEIQKLAGWPKIGLPAAEDEERDRAIRGGGNRYGTITSSQLNALIGKFEEYRTIRRGA